MTTPKRYRKKPVEIEAMQWDGTAAGATPIINWVLENDGNAVLQCADPVRCEENAGDCPHWLTIRTLEGDMRTPWGGWVIRGVKGEFYPCKPDIFAETYDDPEDDDPLLAVRRAEQRLVEARQNLARVNQENDQ
ncbi:hypothetical protein KNU57_gp81 [Gordonia phage Valary]|uniref:Uncharacterized protein n=1 Tax=Gordonia phage Valary TaxID=2588130 RepID=A0A4Y5TZU9_9CAUD|nr:hypothetical protein KNU57_gp81 [Gordonia phage Valary]QDB74949.1 hypothetical protein SEA_VALARY_81 [Gordonia phage Valary]